MVTICFYQDSRHAQPLKWIRRKFGIGYLSKRNDGITELRINGFNQVRQILEQLKPYIKFKKKTLDYALRILRMINGESLSHITKRKRMAIAQKIIQIRNENYMAHKRKYASKDIKKLLSF